MQPKKRKRNFVIPAAVSGLIATTVLTVDPSGVPAPPQTWVQAGGDTAGLLVFSAVLLAAAALPEVEAAAVSDSATVIAAAAHAKPDIGQQLAELTGQLPGWAGHLLVELWDQVRLCVYDMTHHTTPPVSAAVLTILVAIELIALARVLYRIRRRSVAA